jgi:microcystin synthetase protein McyD
MKKLTDSNDDERKSILIKFLETEAKSLLGLDQNLEIDKNLSLTHLGMDSLISVEFRNMITKKLGASFHKALPATLLFNYPNINALASHLLTNILNLQQEIKPKPIQQQLPQISNVIQNEPLAIVGMSCRFPGGAIDLDTYWKMLESGVNAIYNKSKSRPDQDTSSYIGGFLDNIDEFDCEYFKISPEESKCMDPQHRIMLEVVAEALEIAAISSKKLKDSKCGFFLAMQSS